ncbi:MAG TPA: MFS transporter [Iamia sp.]
MRRPSIVVFCTVGALQAAGYGALFTLLDEYRDEYGIGETALGLVIGLGFISAFVAQVTIAPRADRGHARQVVVLGVLLDVAGLVMIAFATSIGPLLAGRFVMGIGIGMATPALRRIVILADPAHLGQNVGRLLAADVAGFAAGPAVSAVLVGPFGIAAPFLVIGVATLLALPVVARTEITETVEATAPRFAFDLLRIRPFAAAVVLGSAVWLMIGSFDALWSLALDDLGAADWLANLGISLFALPLVVLGALGGRLAQRIGPFRVGTAGLLVASVFMLAYGLAPSGVAMFAVAMVHAVTDGLSVSATGVAVGLVVPADRQAGAQGVLGGIQVLVAGVTAPIIGALYEAHGRTVAYTVAASGMVVLVALGLVLAGPAWRLRGDVEADGDQDLGPADPSDPAVVAGMDLDPAG